MKTRNLIRFGIFFLAVAGLTLGGCQKEKMNTNADSSSLQQLSKDEENIQNASDEALNDANLFLSGASLKSTQTLPCHGTVDSTSIENDTITYFITYDGPNCNGRIYRTGQVEIKKKVGTLWGQAGATVIVKYLNLRLTKIASGKTMILNGTKNYQNFSGGFIWQLGNGLPALVHKVWGSLQANFNDTITRTWYVSRQRTFTGSLGNLVLTIDGFGTDAGYSNLVCWGINRNGENFYTQITQSVVLEQTCEFDPCRGIKIHQIPSDNKSATITFGYNDQNQLISGEECPTRFRIDWVKNIHSGTIYLPLP